MKLTFTVAEQDDGVFEWPAPAVRFMPEWLRRMKREVVSNGPFPKKTMKGCVSMIDAYSAGYMLTLPCELRVHVLDGQPIFQLVEGGLEAFLPEQVEGSGWNPAYKLSMPFGVRLPRGYSLLCTHPLNRDDLPFYTLSGIIDDGYDSEVNAIFVWKRREDGLVVLPAGTPLVQVIPFRREPWEHDRAVVSLPEMRRASRAGRARGYRKLFHRRKDWR